MFSAIDTIRCNYLVFLYGYAFGVSIKDIIASAISPVPQGTDIIEKRVFCPQTKDSFFRGDP